MGDNRRSYLFAQWLLKNFPPAQYPRVADLAGGKGKNAQELVKYGYIPTVFGCRRETQKGKKYRRYKRDLEKEQFRPKGFDLIIGMHPDEITYHVIRLAKESKSPFVVVPCCIKPPKIKKGIEINSFEEWLNWLRQQATNMGFTVEQTTLPMRGKSTVLYGRNTKNGRKNKGSSRVGSG